MKVKVGDTVQVIAGADKGKSGKVLRTLKKDHKVVVEGIHIVHKHSKPRTTNDSGGIFEIEAPIDVSNVKVIDVKDTKKSKEKKAKAEVVDTEVSEKPKKTSKKASK